MTQPPSGEQVAVATNALRNEATEWEMLSERLGEQGAKAAEMEFGRLEAGLFQLMVGPYNDVIQAVSARCREGATAMADIADTLNDVADTYDAEDRAAKHRLRNVY